VKSLIFNLLYHIREKTEENNIMEQSAVLIRDQNVKEKNKVTGNEKENSLKLPNLASVAKKY